MLGAGLSSLSLSYELGSDNLLNICLSLPIMETSLISRLIDEQQRGCFWYITNGGDGNFGVMVSITCGMHQAQRHTWLENVEGVVDVEVGSSLATAELIPVFEDKRGNLLL